LSFEANQGQTDPQVRFLSRGSGYALFLTPTEAVLTLQKLSTPPSAPAAPPLAVTGDVLTMRLVGANPNPAVAGLDRQEGTSNYLIGNNPNQWHTGIANFGRVEYTQVYPGIDLAYYGNQRQLEYDFQVSAGADPGVIRLSFQGAESVSLDAAGELVLHAAGSDVVEHAPVLYQETTAGRQAVAGSYVLEGPGGVGFQVGAYDRRLPLIIDPVLSYSTYLGGNNTHNGLGIAVDGAGSAFVTGWTQSNNFPSTPGAFRTTNGGGQDAFVT
jgi:hypothetical protein